MQNAASKAIAAQHALAEVIRQDRGRLLAGLGVRLGHLPLAEDALQEASIAALKHWGRSGVPHNPAAWLMKVALNKGIDHIRKTQRETTKSAAFDILHQHDEPDDAAIPDERLRLIFTCCHPALDEKSRIALTLRSVCGLTTREVAAVFLDQDGTMGQRLSRAKAKLKAKAIGFNIPEPETWPDRLDAVLRTVYLIFTTGYISENHEPRALCREAIFLTELLNQLQPEEPEIEGCLTLMLLTEARIKARFGHDAALVPVEEQDKTLWSDDKISRAQHLLAQAMARQAPGPFQLKAAIADCHMARPKPDWTQMSLLYGALWQYEPTPIVALNWAVVMSETGQAELALNKLEMLKADLENYQPWHASRAHILLKLGSVDVHLSHSMVAAREMNAAKLVSVLQ